jgi:hypothetical protein
MIHIKTINARWRLDREFPGHEARDRGQTGGLIAPLTKVLGPDTLLLDPEVVAGTNPRP